MNKTKIEWADYTRGWIEALIDGEGSLSLLKEIRPSFSAGCTYKPRLNIGNKNLELLRAAQTIIGGGCIIQSKKRQIYLLDVSSSRLRWLLPRITLIVKERQRLLLLDALQVLAGRRGGRHQNPPAGTERLEGIYHAIRQINGRVWNK